MSKKSPDGRKDYLLFFVVAGGWEYGILNALGARRQLEIRERGTKIFRSLFEIVESSQQINTAASYRGIVELRLFQLKFQCHAYGAVIRTHHTRMNICANHILAQRGRHQDIVYSPTDVS